MDRLIEWPATHLQQPVLSQRGERSYSAEIWAYKVDEQSRLIEQVIGFALDTLGVRHLNVRVHPADANYHKLGG